MHLQSVSLMNNYHQSKSPALSFRISLQILLDKLCESLQAQALRNKSTIVSDVPGAINVIIKNQKIIPIITELLDAVVVNSRNSQIHITAERFRDIIILQIQDRNNYNGYALGFSVHSLGQEAADAGGYIQFKDQQQKIATISLSFPNS